ncbi:MAG: HAD-IA family hydrolase, partial [Bryobacterales bacterium]
DSKLDLALAVNAARADAGLGPLAHETIYSYVGNGAPVLIQKSLGPDVDEEQVNQSLQFFLDYYREHMLDNTCLYPGVAEALEKWTGDKKLAVLTNKPERFSKMILDGLGVGSRFARVYGGNTFATKKPDPEGLNRLTDEFGALPSRTLMVGDSAVDVLTARNAGVPSCGVTYGLQPETFEQHPPDLLVDRMEDLVEILCNGRQR